MPSVATAKTWLDKHGRFEETQASRQRQVEKQLAERNSGPLITLITEKDRERCSALWTKVRAEIIENERRKK